jgi:pyruvate/2-oxoglutarate dehydrogenase complex dihydrolipoamide acyltransferase (E2) component
MAIELKIPSLGQGMIEGTIAEWLAADGSQVVAGDPIYTMENEKSTQEIEAPIDGVLHIYGEAGETYPVGMVIGCIE